MPIRVLLENGEEPRLANTEKSTPLLAASLFGHVEVVRWMLADTGAAEEINYANVGAGACAGAGAGAGAYLCAYARMRVRAQVRSAYFTSVVWSRMNAPRR